MQSRRDDLESLGYVLIYFLKGLPWQEIRDFEETHCVKESTTLEQLCLGIPDEFRTYLEYCRNLQYDETPHYEYLYSLFVGLYRMKGYQLDWIFDFF